MIALETLPQIDLNTTEPLDFELPPLDLSPAFELALEYHSAPASEVNHGA